MNEGAQLQDKGQSFKNKVHRNVFSDWRISRILYLLEFRGWNIGVVTENFLKDQGIESNEKLIQ